MKVLRRPIEVIAWFDIEGNPAPLKFRFYDEMEGTEVIKVDKVILRELDRFAGNKMLKYTCQSIMGAEEKVYELRYELDSCKWFLYKK